MSFPAQSDRCDNTCPRTERQRFLVVTSLFHPHAMGGAEISAFNFAQWLQKKGFEIAVITTAKTPEEACEDKVENGMRIWRVWMPRPYPIFDYAKARLWQKIIWHTQDHFDPRNQRVFAHVIDVFKPDYINIHMLQGLGWNALKTIAASRVPVAFFLHDLGLGCVRMGMFREGNDCQRQCLLCRLSCAFKHAWAQRGKKWAFISPSKANMDKLSRHFALSSWPHISILNANKYPKPAHPPRPSDVVRFVYVGRLHASKGVDLLLQAASTLAARHPFMLTVVGSGPDEKKLREKYGAETWCRFTGFVSQQEVANVMGDSDVLCIPSIWAENSPGVVIHALSLGLPVIGSDKAGIPELVEHEKNGLLVPPGDLEAWEKALERVLVSPSVLKGWQDYALKSAIRFDQDTIGQELLDFIRNQAS